MKHRENEDTLVLVFSILHRIASQHPLPEHPLGPELSIRALNPMGGHSEALLHAPVMQKITGEREVDLLLGLVFRQLFYDEKLSSSRMSCKKQKNNFSKKWKHKRTQDKRNKYIFLCYSRQNSHSFYLHYWLNMEKKRKIKCWKYGRNTTIAIVSLGRLRPSYRSQDTLDPGFSPSL